jgi:hypothetical protein
VTGIHHSSHLEGAEVSWELGLAAGDSRWSLKIRVGGQQLVVTGLDDDALERLNATLSKVLDFQRASPNRPRSRRW